MGGLAAQVGAAAALLREGITLAEAGPDVGERAGGRALSALSMPPKIDDAGAAAAAASGLGAITPRPAAARPVRPTHGADVIAAAAPAGELRALAAARALEALAGEEAAGAHAGPDHGAALLVHWAALGPEPAALGICRITGPMAEAVAHAAEPLGVVHAELALAAGPGVVAGGLAAPIMTKQARQAALRIVALGGGEAGHVEGALAGADAERERGPGDAGAV